jgi:hypothetical protein
MPVDTSTKTARIQTNHTGVLLAVPHNCPKALIGIFECLFSNKYAKWNNSKVAIQSYTKLLLEPNNTGIYEKT